MATVYAFVTIAVATFLLFFTLAFPRERTVVEYRYVNPEWQCIEPGHRMVRPRDPYLGCRRLP